VAILKKGELVATGDVNEILATEDIIEIGASDINALRTAIGDLNGYSRIHEHGRLMQLYYPTGTADLESINQYCFNKGVVLNYLYLKKKSLESKFMELTN
jgi:ABC-type multidrug transport system ATPase subunit